MADQIPALTGALRHADAEALAVDLRDRLDGGGLRIDLSGLDGLDFAPLQVLLAAAATADRRGLAFELIAPPDGALCKALAAHALDGALPVRAPLPTMPEKTE